MNIHDFGLLLDGKQTSLFILKNQNGITAGFCNYGARWISFNVPDKDGKIGDIVLGFDKLESYLNAVEQYHGAIVGRVAGRIKQGSFLLNGNPVKLSINERFDNGAFNHLHGGKKGFSFKVWDGTKKVNERGEEAVSFELLSPDGEEGYPGNLQVTVTYTLTNDNAVKIEYSAQTDRPTPVSLTNHAYFNLNGSDNDTILDHSLQISATKFLESDPGDFCVTGNMLAVQHTPMDFMQLKQIGAGINSNYCQLIEGRGYNNFYVLKKGNDSAVPAAILQSNTTGRRLEVFTTAPGLQLYSAGYWNGTDRGKHQIQHQRFGGIALEAHEFPNALNQKYFQGIILQPQQVYRQITSYRFSLMR